NKNTPEQTDENGRIESMISAEQNTEHERREGVRRDQSDGFRLEKGEAAAVTKNQQEFRGGQLQVNHAKKHEDARVPAKCFRLADPKLRDGGSQEKYRDDKILRRLGLLAGKNQHGQA